MQNKRPLLALIVLPFLCLPPSLFADQCPSPEVIKERKISREYAWMIDERRTLEDVLAVKNLYSVRIRENGKFATCYYTTSQQLLEMDASPLKEGCGVIEYRGQWQDVNNTEKVCIEEDVYQCQFAIYCDERSSQ